MIYQTIVALAVVAGASAKLFAEDHTHQKYMWESFKTEHSRNYATMEEETQRFAYFLENLKVADMRNAAELKNKGGAIHGITRFSDLSQAEFESRFLTADASLDPRTGAIHGITRFSDLSQAEFESRFLTADASLRSKDAVRVELETKPDTTASLKDWSGVYTTPVKDQGYCGSCWAFSATEQIESDSMRTLHTSYILSPEQLVQCDTTSHGCQGGWTEHAYNYVTKAGGIETESAYPYSSYQGTTGSCKSSASQFVIGVSGYTTIKGESSMASYVQSTGPLSVCLDASTWNSYKGGIMTSCPKQVDHCVQAVGVDASTGGYWKVRNSWGTSWGESSGVYTTPVKDQGYCGSCWAFSATEQIESDSMRTLKTSYILSPEQLVQCDTTSHGCQGGWTEHAYKYVTKAGGIETEAAYPYSSYQGTTGTCKSSASQFVIGVTSYTTIQGESSMASYMQSTGPLSVCLDASTWNSYKGGIMTTCPKQVDHCVQAVGVDASASGYWKVRNSWGTSWGESGYIRLAYGQNTCAITS
eukprot:CAMPEP_0185011776 /NCGR_PEP_ID=MMETSP1098-20130426/97960_1 /TAXON_ID=89044 /ORGANISM="Spumella elongata, Strain CCAP 955/1" /LENGTH=529 /DNA_ID=CAMNT_0027540817 /DNA_START=29 /DNA_END=1616 /DNA_ORIENTATION=-